jgi:hypothetical protein
MVKAYLNSASAFSRRRYNCGTARRSKANGCTVIDQPELRFGAGSQFESPWLSEHSASVVSLSGRKDKDYAASVDCMQVGFEVTRREML